MEELGSLLLLDDRAIAALPDKVAESAEQDAVASGTV